MKIHIYHANAGHGHRKVAEVTAEALHAKGLSAQDVKVFDGLDFTPGYFRSAYPATYYYSVKHIPKIWGWFYETLDLPKIYGPVRGLRSIYNHAMGKRLIEEVRREKPDVVLCAHFFTAELFASAKKRGEIQSTLITIITDFYPHTFWVNEGTDYYWVMGEEGKKDLLGRGVSAEKIIAGGIPVAPAFKPLGRKNEILKKWNLDPDRFTVLFTSGSFGLGKQAMILKEMEPFKDKIQCLVVCGNNKQLETDLKREQWPFPVQVFGFVDFMPDLMEASDLMLAKPGGSTTTESLAKGLPMVILDPIPGQESRNAKLLLENNASFTIAEPFQIRPILKAVLEQPQVLKDKHAIIKKIARPNAAEDLADFVIKSAARES